MEAGPPDFGSFVQDVDDETLLAAARNEEGENEFVEDVADGAKLLQVTFDRITFIDSLPFFQMPLSAFPKTFGRTELKKGYFLHLFNTLSNQSYVGIQHGRIPDTSYFLLRRDFEA